MTFPLLSNASNGLTAAYTCAVSVKMLNFCSGTCYTTYTGFGPGYGTFNYTLGIYGTGARSGYSR
jgi:hypothetical protein